MTTRALTRLEANILDARRDQLAARIAADRSPNSKTIAAEQMADERVNLLLDRLLASLECK